MIYISDNIMKNWSCPGLKHTFPNNDVDNLLIDMKR